STFGPGLLALLVACAPTAGTAPTTSARSSTREAGPWPDWIPTDLNERVLSRCTDSSSSYSALSTDKSGRVAPFASVAKPKSARWDPLPGAEVPLELSQAAVPGTRRTALRDDAGWLVAMDAGEFGGGLYAWDERASSATQLDAALPEAIRWIGRFDFGIVGVAGLCHGEGCALTTAIYDIRRAAAGWSVSRLAELQGCPIRVIRASGDEALLLTCRALHSITASGVVPVAEWQEGLHPVPWEASAVRDSTGAAYVSFGQMIGRFAAQTTPRWFARRSCLQARGSEVGPAEVRMGDAQQIFAADAPWPK
ncbi:MAG: hypothetical protein K0R38_4066, partial [Polyangiaceae bacterium]|nr:hypothetical protein [Polyangiaceae bacterium]